jgi:hypothetical protein
MHIGLLWANQKERDHCKDLDVGGKKYKMYYKETGWSGMDLAQDRH